MRRRICGLETEYGTWWGDQGKQPNLRVDSVISALLAHAPVLAVNGFLYNGARLYPDCGHVEYATAECATPREALVSDRAGEEMVENLPRSGADRLFRIGLADVRMFKNTTDGHGNTYGCHENYLVGVGTTRGEVARRIAGHLLTRSVWAGAGHWNGERFLVTQRGAAMEEVTGTGSMRARPLVHLKEEALCDPKRWYRLHVLAGDANMSEVVTWLKLASTHLVLRCVEESPDDWADWCPANVAGAFSALDRDLSGRGRYRTTSGAWVDALGVQYWYHDRAGELLEREGGDDWEFEAHHRWGRLLDDLASEGVAGLVSVADWATKLALLERVAGRSRSGMSDPKVAYAALRYHELGDGYARRLEAAGHLERLTSVDEVEAARTSPPATRAAKRGAFVAWSCARGVPGASVAWDVVRVAGRALHLPDPFDHRTGEVTRWVDEVEETVSVWLDQRTSS